MRGCQQRTAHPDLHNAALTPCMEAGAGLGGVAWSALGAPGFILITHTPNIAARLSLVPQTRRASEDDAVVRLEDGVLMSDIDVASLLGALARHSTTSMTHAAARVRGVARTPRMEHENHRPDMMADTHLKAANLNAVTLHLARKPGAASSGGRGRTWTFWSCLRDEAGRA